MKESIEALGRGLLPPSRASAARRARRGVAIVPAMLLAAALALVAMALLTTSTSNTRALDSRSEEYRSSSAVETAATLAIDDLWSRYERWVGGSPRTIGSFRRFMDAHLGGIPDRFDRFDTDDDGKLDTIPMPGDGTDLAAGLALPAPNGKPQVGHVDIDAIEVVRLDLPRAAAGFGADTTQLFLTVSASITRGDGIVNPIESRAVQQVYAVEPDDVAGFDFARPADDVDCIFGHPNVSAVASSYGLEDEAERAPIGADLGILAPGYRYATLPSANASSLPGLPIGLRLGNDQRLRHPPSVPTPAPITLRRKLWNPTANLPRGER